MANCKVAGLLFTGRHFWNRKCRKKTWWQQEFAVFKDSFSHKATLKTNVGTIAVVGNGLNYIYPPENKELEEKILENNGLIISEYD